MSIVGWPIGSSAPDVVGEMVQSEATGKNVGYRVLSTNLAGSWMGNSMSRLFLPPQTLGDASSGRLLREGGHGQMWFFLNADGTFDAYADGCRDAGNIIRGGKFSGRIFKISDFAFNLINGVEGETGWGELYYPLFLNPERNHSTIFLMDSSAVFDSADNCRDYGSLFGEYQWFTKVSDEVDLDIMRDVRAISDQWLWQPQPEDGAPGEQYPDTCP